MRQKLFPEAADPGLEQYREQLFDSICRHLVCLGVRTTFVDEQGDSNGLEYLSHYTFFVASVGDRWYLVTAGHVLESLDIVFGDRTQRVLSSFLADYFGPRAATHTLLRFPYELGMGTRIYDKKHGVDFGCIPISEQLKSDLKVNRRKPLSEAHWRREVEPEILMHWVLGFPADINQQYNEPIRAGEERRGIAATVMLSADRIDESQVTEHPSGWQTTIPRFIGRINVDIPFGIEGMSGGPIFGACRHPSGLTGYTLVALQSEWYPDSKTIFGCPSRVFGELLTVESERLASEHPE